jgi:hypothetical protein
MGRVIGRPAIEKGGGGAGAGAGGSTSGTGKGGATTGVSASGVGVTSGAGAGVRASRGVAVIQSGSTKSGVAAGKAGNRTTGSTDVMAYTGGDDAGGAGGGGGGGGGGATMLGAYIRLACLSARVLGAATHRPPTRF